MFAAEMFPFIFKFEPLFETQENNHPPLLKEYLGKRVSIETMIILDVLVEYSGLWDKVLVEDIVWPDVKKLMNNYKRFLTIDKEKYRMILLNLIEEHK